MKNKIRFLAMMLIGVLLSVNQVWGAERVIFFNETFGTPTGNTNVTSYEGWSETGVTYSGSAKVGINSSNQCGLSGSSGSGYMYESSSSIKEFVVSGINTSGYTNIKLSINRKGGSTSARFTIAYSTNGTSYTNLYSNSSCTTGYVNVAPEGNLPSSKSLYIKITNTATNYQLYFDDLILSGEPSTPPVTYTDYLTDCGPSIYTVTFDANGGSVSPTSATQESEGATISLPTPTLNCYDCTGWYTEASGGTKRGDAGGSYVPTATEKLYAQWTPKRYDAIYDANGVTGYTGELPATVTYDCGDQVAIDQSQTLSKFGYTFIGWNTNPAATTPQPIGSNPFTIDQGDTRIYAIWEATKPTGIAITPETGGNTPVKGTGVQMLVTLTPDASTMAEENREVTWSSNNTTYATVNQSGYVNFVGQGTVTIYATSKVDGSIQGNYIFYVQAGSCVGWEISAYNKDGQGNSYNETMDFFRQVGSGNEWKVKYVLPNGTRKFWVGNCDGWWDPQYGGHSKEWDFGWIRFKDRRDKGCGNNTQYPGQDAVGELIIWSNSTDENYGIAFLPNYKISYMTDGSNWRIMDFHATSEQYNYETDIFQVPAGYKSNSSMIYYVGIEKNDGSNMFVADGISSMDPMNGVNGLKDADMAGKYGKWHIWSNSCDNNWYCEFYRYYQVRFEMNGGEGNIDPMYFYGDNSQSFNTNTLTNPTKTGYNLTGWKDQEDHTYTTSQSITVTKDLVLTAQWEEKGYVNYRTSCTTVTTVTLNKGDHGQANGSATIKLGTSTFSSWTDVVAAEHFDLIGYYDGDTKVINTDGTLVSNVSGWTTADGKWDKDATTATLTAKFTQRTYIVTLKDNDAEEIHVVNEGESYTLPTLSCESDDFEKVGWTKTAPTDNRWASKPSIVNVGATVSDAGPYYAVYGEGGGEAPTNDYKLITGSEFESGANYVIAAIVDASHIYAMSANNYSSSYHKFERVKVSPDANNVIKDVDAKLVWKLTNNSIYSAQENKYVGVYYEEEEHDYVASFTSSEFTDFSIDFENPLLDNVEIEYYDGYQFYFGLFDDRFEVLYSKSNTTALYKQQIGEGMSYISNPVCCVDKVAAPVVNATKTHNSITLSWSNVDGATGYKVTINGDTHDVTTSSCSYTASGLIPNTAYSWTVVATWDSEGAYCGAIPANGTTTTNPVYTVTYVKAGGETGSVPTDANTYPQGGSVTVAGKNTLSYSGYDFAGWECSQDGETYAKGATVMMGSSNMTFTAVWTPKTDTYFDDIHKTAGYTGDGHIEEGKYTVPTLGDDSRGSNSCEKGHSVFVGWVAESSTKPDGTLKSGFTIVYGGTENKAANNIRYHAVWAESSK